MKWFIGWKSSAPVAAQAGRALAQGVRGGLEGWPLVRIARGNRPLTYENFVFDELNVHKIWGGCKGTLLLWLKDNVFGELKIYAFHPFSFKI